MTLNIGREMSLMSEMTPKELRQRYAEVFGETTRTGNKTFLVRRIAWKLQANAEGDLSERARHRAAELAQGADIRTTTPQAPPATAQTAARTTTHAVKFAGDNRLPPPGTMLTRQYKGRTLAVMVLPTGFEFEGQRYKSLSAVAKAITGAHYNGFLFFNLVDKP